MHKLKLFIENMLVYGLSSIFSKLVPLIMIPIITRLMPDSSYFGLSDLTTTLLQFGSALAGMGMYDAMYRMFFEKEEEAFKKTVCSTALVFVCFCSIIIFILMVIFRAQIAQFFYDDSQYAYLVYLAAMAILIGTSNSIVAAPARMENRRVLFLVTNTLSPIISYSISIPLLLNGYYTIALPLSNLISVCVIEVVFLVVNGKWFRFRKFDFSMLRQLLAIALPLLPNFLVYWLFNSSDRLMVTRLIGIDAAGIYAIGAKLGLASQLIYSAFSGGWQFFAFSTMKEENQVKSNSSIFEYLGAISFGASAFIFAWSEPIFKLLFPAEYFSGYITAPYLFMAPLLQMLFHIAVNQFLVIKKTWPNALLLFAGAAVNVVLNLLLIPVLGIEGASIATLIGYAVSVVLCVLVLCQMKLMVVSTNFYLATGATIAFIFIWRFITLNMVLVNTALAAVLCVVLVLLYRKDLALLINGIKRKSER